MTTRLWVFGYGSLLHPESLASTLHGMAGTDCVPVLALGYRRTWGVAFPNDGSQPDKAYFDAAGGRPALVAFLDLRPSAPAGKASAVNGVAIPVTPAQLVALAGRERRYQAVDLTADIRGELPGPATQVLGFVGRQEFTSWERGHAVVPATYQQTIAAGVAHWDRVRPGFAAQFHASTEPAPRVAELRRVDLRP